MTRDVRKGGPPCSSFLAKLRRRLWELSRRRREDERRRREEGEKTEKRRLLRESLAPVLLALLEGGDEHGHGIVRKLENAKLPPWPLYSIYAVLRGLERDGFVEGYVVATDEGPAVRYYRILPAGTAALGEEWDGWRELVGATDLPPPRGRER